MSRLSRPENLSPPGVPFFQEAQRHLRCCFINPYIKTHRKNRRKKTTLSYTDSQWRRWPRLPETHRGCRVQGCRMLKSPVTSGPKPGRLHLGFSREIQPLWRNQLAVKWGFLKKQISFPWISPFHWYHPFSKKLLYEWEELHLLSIYYGLGPQFRYYFIQSLFNAHQALFCLPSICSCRNWDSHIHPYARG